MNNTEQSKLIKKFHDEWCLANGYKPSSTREQEARPQAKGSSFKPKSTSCKIFSPGTSEPAPGSGYRQQG